MDGLTLLISGLGTFLLAYIIQNPQLKEGLTKIFLNRLGKINLTKIDLKHHKIFITLRNYKNQLDITSFSNELKGEFCKEYIIIIIENIILFLQELSNSYGVIEEEPSNENKKIMMENLILETFEKTISNINESHLNKLNIPSKVNTQFNSWKQAQLRAFKFDIESVVHDDSLNDNYYRVYKVFDKTSSFVNYINANFALLFTNINGAFDTLSKNDLFKKVECSDTLNS